MHFKKSVLKNHLLYSIITLMAIAMLFPITAFAQAVNSNPRIPFVTQDSLFVNENPVL